MGICVPRKSHRGCVLKAALKFASLSLALPAILLSSAVAGTKTQQRWSVDITRYVYPRKRQAKKVQPYSNVYLAATDNYVGAASDVGDPTSGPLKSSLLIFDASSGKLHQKCGPWNGHMILGFWATANGNFLLTWEPFPETRGAGAKLSLFSPSCTELQKFPLPAFKGAAYVRWNVLLSPSRKTLLIIEREKATTRFTVCNADTFAVLSEWQQPESDVTIASVSDKGLLALEYLKPADLDFSPAKVFYRSFSSASWHDLTDALVSTNQNVTASFLSNDIFVEGADIGNQGVCNPTEAQIEVRGVSGRLVSSATFSKDAHQVDFPLVGSLSLSADGRFFGDLLRFTNTGWFWCNFDMRLEHSYAYIWSSSTMKPAARIRLDSVFPELPLAIAPSGTWFAIVRGNDLSVRALKPPKGTSRH